jgi:hypothetical protein
MKAKVIKRLNKRNFPSAEGNSPLPNPHEPGDIIEVVEEVKGTFHGDPPTDKWFRTDKGYYVWSGGVKSALSGTKSSSEIGNSENSNDVSGFGVGISTLVGRRNNLPSGTGKGVKVFILDSGVDMSNPFIAENVIFNWDERINSSVLKNSHGSMVAGTIASRNSHFIGIAPDVEILSYKVIDNNSNTNNEAVYLALKDIERRIDRNGRYIVNMSLSISPNDSIFKIIKEDIQNILKYDIPVIVSGLNRGFGISNLVNIKGVFSVGAIEKNIPNEISYFFLNREFQTIGIEGTSFFKDSSAYTAVVTGILARILGEGIEKKTISDLKSILNEISSQINSDLYFNPFKFYRL